MALVMQKHKMPEQDPKARAHNFDEVALGYTEELAVAEANRCLHCKVPHCRKGCPVEVDIPEFIAKIKERDFVGADEKIKESNSLPAICGRVCPQENQCEKYCVMGIKGEPVGIGRLERFVADYCMQNGTEKIVKTVREDMPKVAIIGSGPAGLACAGDLVKLGYQVTIFEALHTAGGVLSYGIPEFRLPKEDVVKPEIDNLRKMGVKIEVNAVIGKLFTIDDLMQEYGFSAVFVATGAGLPHFMNIPGENFNGVYSSNEFLTRCNLMKAYRFPQYATPIKVGKVVAVVGGGNVAMDSARTALRLGAEHVYIVYRRSEAELPARREEVEHAKEEGIDFRLLNNPVEILGDANGYVTGIRCIKMELGEPDASGRRSPVPIEGAIDTLDVDLVIVSIGVMPNPIIPTSVKGLEISKKGTIVVDEKMCSSKRNLYAGGDIVRGGATVILAMGDGRKAAKMADEALKNAK